MRKLLCLVAILGAFAAAGCWDDDEDTGGTNAGAQCQDSTTTLSCSKLETCCTDSSHCWYNATRDGTTKKFDCAGGSCQTAAQDAVAFCQ